MTINPRVREPSRPGRPEYSGNDRAPRRLVISDDDPETLELLYEMLRSRGMEIRLASSGAELGVLLAEQGPFDLIVTDIDMPWMEGLSVIRSARAAEIETPAFNRR
jgi:CheY-like chemotaxis protein